MTDRNFERIIVLEKRIVELEKFVEFLLEDSHIATYGPDSMESGQIKHHYDEWLKENNDEFKSSFLL